MWKVNWCNTMQISCNLSRNVGKRKSIASCRRHVRRCKILLVMALQFQEITAVPSQNKISVYSMSCAGNETTSKKLQKKLKTLNILTIFLSAILLTHRVARLQFFPCDNNVINLGLGQTGSHLHFSFSDAHARPSFSVRIWEVVSRKHEDWQNL